MSYRMGRLAHVVRDVVSDAISNHVWDPRVQRFTSVTRVEISGDMRQAEVFVSVMGTDTEAETTMKGLQSARGMIQTLLAKELKIRQCPLIRFHLDKGLKTAIETFRQLKELAPAEPSNDSDDVGESAPEDRETAGPENPPAPSTT